MKMMKKLKNPKKIGEVKIGTTKYPIYLADKIYPDNLINRLLFYPKILGEIKKSLVNGEDKYIALVKHKKRKLKDIFYHEVTHGLMYELSKIKRYKITALALLGDDEHFIDTFARILQRTFNLKNIQMEKQYENFQK